MFRTFHITVNGNPEPVVKAIFSRMPIRRHDRAVSTEDLGTQKEDICPSVSCQNIDMFQDTCSGAVGVSIHDKVDIDIHGGTSL
jgi:hypothetical protein